MEKLCVKCNIIKDIKEFSNRKTSKDGYRNECKDCIKKYKEKYNKIWYKNNKDKINKKSKEWATNNPDKIKERNKISRLNSNKDKTKILMKEYRQINRKRLLEQRKDYLKRNPEMKKKFNSNRYKNMNSLQKLRLLMRNNLNKILKRNGYTKNSKSIEIYGCSYEFLYIYLESKFESWMNWNNHGEYNGEFNHGWDIDHIIPLSSAKTEEDVIKLNHYTNLQPLCSKINRDIKRDLTEYIL